MEKIRNYDFLNSVVSICFLRIEKLSLVFSLLA